MKTLKLSLILTVLFFLHTACPDDNGSGSGGSSCNPPQSTICLNDPIPSGWIIMSKDHSATACQGQSDGTPENCNVLIITNLNAASSGCTLQVVNGIVPSGWTKVGTSRLATLCGASSIPGEDNIMTIRKN